MVTKAELEAEVAQLRRQLAEQSSVDSLNGTADQNPAPATDAEAPKTKPHDLTENFEALAGQLEGALAELEDLPHKKPILFALGVFTLGYLVGRSR